MIETQGDIWEKYDQGQWVVIPTNGDTNRWGLAVMGRGLAKDTAKRIPGMTYGLAEKLEVEGNHVYEFSDIHLFTFPVKRHWHEDADLALIKRSALELSRFTNKTDDAKVVYLPRVGCGNGRRMWSEVKPILESTLDDKFIVVSRASQGLP